jgi:hypothetical protein
MTRESVFDLTEEEVLERVEAAAAAGDDRAAFLLRHMLEERQRTGEIHMFDRLASRSYLFGDRHAEFTQQGDQDG